MAQVNRIIDGMTLTAALFALGMAGCGSQPDSSPQTPYIPPTGIAGTGVIGTAGTGTIGAAGTLATTPIAGTWSTPVTAGTGAAAAGTLATVTAGKGAAGTAAAGTTGSAGTSAAAGAGGASAGAGGSGENVIGDSNWDPTASLDSNGVLKVPASGEGYQIETTTFDLQPGQEVFKCFHVAAPNTAVFPVGEWDGQMTPGSHHFILYRADSDSTATTAGVLTNSGCTQGFGGSTWLYTQGTPRSHLKFPDAVAMEVASGEKLNFDMHYINTGTDVIHAHIILNMNKVAMSPYQKADAEISFNAGINVPPHGTQTVSGDCPPVAGANYFVMQTHTHKHATLAVVNRKLADGTLGEELVRTTNWDNPQAHVWEQAPFLTFQTGEKFHYSCSYQNDSAVAVTVGTSASTNEMCMAEAYFYPASGTTPSCN
jgi:hypothetical protein